MEIRKLNLFFLLYFAISVAICWCFSGYELIKSFFALPALLIIPVYLGRLLTKKFIVISWGLGMVLIFLIYLIIFLLINNIFLVSAVIILLLVIEIIRERKNREIIKLNYYSCTAAGIGLVVCLIISYFSPYPYIYDTDQFRHLDFINQIINGRLFIGQWAFPGLFHSFLAVLSVLFNFFHFPYVIFWAARFATFPIFSLGIYQFIAIVIKNKKIALLGSLLAPLVLIEFLSLINFAPKIISMILLPFLLAIIIRPKEVNYLLLISIIIVSLTTHIYMGLVNLFVILSWLLFQRFSNKKIIYIICLIPLAFISAQALNLISLSQMAIPIHNELDLTHYDFQYNFDKLLIYFPIAILFFILIVMISKGTNKFYYAFYPSLLFIVAVYFSPLNASYRVLASIIPLVILFTLIFITDYLRLINNIKLQKYFFIFISLVLIVVCSQNYYQTIKKVGSLPNNSGYFSIVTPQEFAASNWLRNSKINNQIIASDPVNSLALSVLSGNAISLTADETMNKILLEPDEEKAFNFIKAKESDLRKKIIIFIDGRTTFWLKEKNNKQVYIAPNQSKKYKIFSGANKFFNKKYFKIIYQDNANAYLIESI